MWPWRAAPRVPVSGLGDEVPFLLRLAQAIDGCEPRASATDPAGSLRTPGIRPALLERDRASTVRSLAGHRDRWRPLEPVRDAAGLRGGRLLVFYPDGDLADGAAEEESGGFFDVNNTPPWDCWVALFEQERGHADRSTRFYLVSWVPPVLVPFAQRGIEVNPEECIAWLDDVQTPLGALLRDARILK